MPHRRANLPAAPPLRSQAAFARLASHELRTPLNSVIGFSEIIAGELYGPLGSPQYAEYAGIVRDSGQRLLKLVNQVLEVVRLQDDGAQASARSVGLGQAVDDAVVLSRAELDACGLEVKVDASVHDAWVRADPRALGTVLASLLQAEAMTAPAGGRAVIRSRHFGARVALQISVCNGTPGVATEDRPLLFSPSDPLASDGTEFNLQVAQLLCAAMGGGLRVDRDDRGCVHALVVLAAAEPIVPAIAREQRRA